MGTDRPGAQSRSDCPRVHRRRRPGDDHGAGWAAAERMVVPARRYRANGSGGVPARRPGRAVPARLQRDYSPSDRQRDRRAGAERAGLGRRRPDLRPRRRQGEPVRGHR
jgi:hypothetical protein